MANATGGWSAIEDDQAWEYRLKRQEFLEPDLWRTLDDSELFGQLVLVEVGWLV